MYICVYVKTCLPLSVFNIFMLFSYPCYSVQNLFSLPLHPFFSLSIYLLYMQKCITFAVGWQTHVVPEGLVSSLNDFIPDIFLKESYVCLFNFKYYWQRMKGIYEFCCLLGERNI